MRNDVRLSSQLIEGLTDIANLVTALRIVYQIAVADNGAVHGRVGGVPVRLRVVMGEVLE